SCLHFPHVVDHVAAGQLADEQQHPGAAVLEGDRLAVLRTVDGAADVLDADRRAVLIRDDHVTPRVRLQQLVVVVDGEVLVRTVDGPLGRVHGCSRDEVGDVLELQAHRGELHRIDLYTHRRLLLAAHTHVSDAGQLRELLSDHGLGVIVDLGHRQYVRGHREDDDRVVSRVVLAVRGWRGQVLRQLPTGGVDGRLDVARRGIDVAVEIELQRDLCTAEHTGRGHLRYAGNLRKLR